VSEDMTVKQGEDVTLECEADGHFDTCTWHLPSGGHCGPLSSSQKMCRASTSIHFNGSDTSCIITVKNIREKDNGNWLCSLEENGNEVNSSRSVHVTEARKPIVEFEGVGIGSLEITNRGEATVTCLASHGRPEGSFQWFMGKELDVNAVLLNDHTLETSPKENGYVESSQDYTIIPRPELDGQNLYCVHTQVDQSGRLLYEEIAELEIQSHYLAVSPSTPVIPPAQQGDDLDIIVHFEAQPKPEYGNIVWRVVKDNNNEVVLTVEEDDPKEAFNYIAYPIRQVSPDSEYEYEAKLTILNISKSERNYQHFLDVKTRLRPNSLDLEMKHQFDVQVDSFELPPEPESNSTTTIIIIVVLLILIAIIVAAMLIIYAKKNNKWCFAGRTSEITKSDNTEQKEPLQVQHHPYARPSS